jgi:CrcB protein
VNRGPLTVPMLAAVATGGAAGAVLRWSLGVAVPDGTGFPGTTFAINLTGCFVLAALPAVVHAARRPLWALALGPGVLGGYTTLSTYAEQGRTLLADGATALAGAYLLGTLVACLIAVHLGGRLATPEQRRDFAEHEGDE